MLSFRADYLMALIPSQSHGRLSEQAKDFPLNEVKSAQRWQCPTQWTDNNSVIMRGDAQSNNLHSNRCTGRTKVKSGCHTCMMAMGFGVEGETSTAIANVARFRRSAASLPGRPACLPILAVGMEEEKQPNTHLLDFATCSKKYLYSRT
jgi:hypothetical protein